MTRRPGGRIGESTRDALEIAVAADEASAGLDALLLDADRLAQTIATGVHGRRRAGPGETFWQHRPYGFGDPAAAIDWRQSARGSGRLYVRQTEWEAAATAWIWADHSASMRYASAPSLPQKRRRADVIATAIAGLLARGGERIGLVGGRPQPWHGRAAARQFLEALMAQADDGRSAPVVDNVAAGAATVMIGDFYERPEAIEDAASAFAEKGAIGVILQIVDPAEESFPFAGRTEFEDLESSDRLVFGDAASIRESYRAAFDAHRRALAALADSIGWRFIPHSTAEPAAEATLAVYLALVERPGGRHA